MKAKEHAKDIARSLDREFGKGDAAKALALMGAAEYAGEIVKLLDDESSLVRSDAALALGILQATQYAKDVHRLLQDPEEFVRPSAAASLVLMESTDYAKEALELLQGYKYASLGFAVHPIVADECRRVNARFNEVRERMAK